MLLIYQLQKQSLSFESVETAARLEFFSCDSDFSFLKGLYFRTTSYPFFFMVITQSRTDVYGHPVCFTVYVSALEFASRVSGALGP